LGEAALVRREWSEAEAWYQRAGEMGRGQFRQLQSTRRQARLLMEHLGGDRDRIERCFAIPRVAVFAGHMIDRPERVTPRFPPRLELAVQAAINQRIEQRGIGVGYASAACGSDILFLEAILERGGEAHVILPYDKEQFLRDSVRIIPGARWSKRYRRVLERATEVLVATERRLGGGSVSYEYANLMLHGLAGIRAAQLETDLVPLAVWDGQPGDGPGGTGSIVARWQRLGYEVELIDLGELLRRECSPVSPPGGSTAPPTQAP
jgi:hypothetical protein